MYFAYSREEAPVNNICPDDTVDVNCVKVPVTVADPTIALMVPTGRLTATFCDMLELELVIVLMVVSEEHDLKQPLE